MIYNLIVPVGENVYTPLANDLRRQGISYEHVSHTRLPFTIIMKCDCEETTITYLKLVYKGLRIENA